jgi:endogenous inhibitor of DNA gyrase (YacG/DUF329 family)
VLTGKPSKAKDFRGVGCSMGRMYINVAYRQVKMPGHPLARKSGTVMVHRLVLYQRIGPGEHSCHWCGKAVRWGLPLTDPAALVSDHVDGNPRNAEDYNLVPSCSECNTSRMKGLMLGRDEFYIPYRQGKHRAKSISCPRCGTAFVSRTNSIGMPYTKYCSKKCVSLAKSEWAKQTVHQRVPLNAIKEGELAVECKGQRYRARRENCAICGKQFLTRLHQAPNRGKLCSMECRHAYQSSLGDRVGRTCEHCGKTFTIHAHDERWHPYRFCSKSCAAKSAPAEHLQKLQSAAAESNAKRAIKDDELFIEVGTARKRKRAVRRICEFCNVEFLAKETEVNRGGGRFCSVSCKNLWFWRKRKAA